MHGCTMQKPQFLFKAVTKCRSQIERLRHLRDIRFFEMLFQEPDAAAISRMNCFEAF